VQPRLDIGEGTVNQSPSGLRHEPMMRSRHSLLASVILDATDADIRRVSATLAAAGAFIMAVGCFLSYFGL